MTQGHPDPSRSERGRRRPGMAVHVKPVHAHHAVDTRDVVTSTGERSVCSTTQ